MRRLPGHATVAAYLALFIAIATGGAYAMEQFGSADIANNAIRSIDLKNGRAVTGKDVRADSLRGREIAESGLDATGFLSATGVNDAGDCDPNSTSATDCVTVDLSLARSAQVVAMASGGIYGSGPAPYRAGCDLRIDGTPRPLVSTPGETVATTSAAATDGFARTLVTPEPIPAGPHKVSLACSELSGDVRIATPTIAAFAISTGK